MNGIRLEGERVVLREWRLDDREAMYRLMGDPEVTRFLSWGRLTPAQCARRLNDFISYQNSCVRKKYLGPWWHDSAITRAMRRYAHSQAPGPVTSCNGNLECHRSRYYLAIELRHCHRVIGESVFQWNLNEREKRRGEVGYFLEKEFWGRGYATEATLLMINFAFATLDASALTAACDPRNRQSERVMQKCGLERDQIVNRSGTIVATMTKASWLASRADRATLKD
jgi:RimJ/RimL family protein N-acetyltransferase